MKKIAVIAAMDKEIALLKSLDDPRISVFPCGIGKVSASVNATKIIEECHPDLIINSGVAGGLDTSLHIGEIILGQTLAYHDVWCGEPNAVGQIQGFPPFFASDPSVLEKLKETARAGLIVSGDRFISDPAELQNIKKTFPTALAVDMESTAIAQTCYMYHTPFLAVRLISDTPGVEHHQEQYDSFWKTASERSFENLRNLLEKI